MVGDNLFLTFNKLKSLLYRWLHSLVLTFTFIYVCIHVVILNFTTCSQPWLLLLDAMFYMDIARKDIILLKLHILNTSFDSNNIDLRLQYVNKLSKNAAITSKVLSFGILLLRVDVAINLLTVSFGLVWPYLGTISARPFIRLLPQKCSMYTLAVTCKYDVFAQETMEFFSLPPSLILYTLT